MYMDNSAPSQLRSIVPYVAGCVLCLLLWKKQSLSTFVSFLGLFTGPVINSAVMSAVMELVVSEMKEVIMYNLCSHGASYNTLLRDFFIA